MESLRIWTMPRKLAAESLGTFWLVFGGLGTAVLAGPSVGPLGIAFAFGLSMLTMVYAVGAISGAHLNPAITVGAWVAGRFPRSGVLPYIAAQVVGGFVAAALVLMIARGRAGGYSLAWGGLGANGYGLHSPGGYTLEACFLAEVLLSFAFVFVMLGVTSEYARAGFAGLSVGLCLTLVHLISLPLTNTSVNPARSTAPALLVGDWALSQLWLFWVAPLIGGSAAGAVIRLFAPSNVGRTPRVSVQLEEVEFEEEELPDSEILPPDAPPPTPPAH
jgi:aquaporin Z